MTSFSPKGRRQSLVCRVGGIPIGGGHPVVVQSMTDTDTADAEATAEQAAALAAAGSELVRITVDRAAAAKAVPEIAARLADQGCPVPLVGDFHFVGHRLLKEHPECAQALAKFRINPGNVGRGVRHDPNFAAMVSAAVEHGKPIRIGVNAGSLDPEVLASRMDSNANRPTPLSAEEVEEEALVESALQSAEAAVELGLLPENIVISCKVSRVATVVRCYRQIAKRCPHALHLGLTEAGTGLAGVVGSTAALSVLLADGIGDTIRASLTPDPGGDRTKEVRVCQEILQALGLRSYRPTVVACPGCGRTTSAAFRELTATVDAWLAARLPEWHRTRPWAESLKVAVMGCVVNGPGESRAADIGISLPGTGEAPKAPVYVDGERVAILEGAGLAEQFLAMVGEYVDKRWGQ